MPEPAADGRSGDEALLEFAAVMRRLRAECPWKREQTHRSLQRYLLEETYETLEAIDAGEESGDWDHLREELGDLLLQVYFHAVVAEESGAFSLADVAAGITDKMRRRNQHVFGVATGEDLTRDLTADQVNELWQQAKAEEQGRVAPGGVEPDEGPDLTAGLPAALPALAWADKVADRAERAGRPLAVDGTAPEIGIGIGEELLALVLRARAEGVDPEQELRRVVRRRTRGSDED